MSSEQLAGLIFVVVFLAVAIAVRRFGIGKDRGGDGGVSSGMDFDGGGDGGGD